MPEQNSNESAKPGPSAPGRKDYNLLQKSVAPCNQRQSALISGRASTQEADSRSGFYYETPLRKHSLAVRSQKETERRNREWILTKLALAGAITLSWLQSSNTGSAEEHNTTSTLGFWL